MALKFINAGGSLTLSAVLLAAVWAIRSIRAAAKLQRAKSAASNAQNGLRTTPRYLCQLTPAAIALLVKLDAVPHSIIDVRTADESAANPLPSWLNGVVNIPEQHLTAALAPPHSAWFKHTSSTSSCNNSNNAGDDNSGSEQLLPRPPLRHHLLVVIGADDQQEAQAADKSAAQGFYRVALLKGGLKGLLQYEASAAVDSSNEFAFRPAAAAEVADQPTLSKAEHPMPAVAQLPSLHRDALALLLDLVPLPESAYALCSSMLGQKDLLLQQQQQLDPNSMSDGFEAPSTTSGSGSQRLLVIDVRRHDERTLYGSIPGTVHVPVDELPSALQLHPDQFRRRYHFEAPTAADVLVMQSRASTRAQWAGQLAVDAGLPSVFVYQDGVFDWRLSPAVQAYAAYQQAEAPPDPEPSNPVDQPDIGAGIAELQQLGLLQLLLLQHSVH